MLLLHPRRPSPDRPARLVAVFGVGLLGGTVNNALSKNHLIAHSMDLCWQDPDRQRRQIAAIRRAIDDELEAFAFDGVSFLWTAGKADFASSEDETAAELASFARIVELAESVAQRSVACTFHMVSSIGGLFEGQRHVSRDSQPRAQRPYGDLKKRQEDLLLNRESPIGRRIYRLTSVFGAASRGERRGLITTLVHNGQRRRSTRIVGRLTTLRDFVWSADVADFLTGELTRPVEESASTRTEKIRTLASGKPSSIF